MKKTLLTFRYIAFVSLFFAFAPACTKSCQKGSSNNSSVLRIGTNANFPPFESINDKGELIGFDIDMGRALGEKLMRRVQFKEYDFDALILALNKGQIDIILSGLSITESRQKEIAMVAYQGEPLTEISFLFWHHVPDNATSFSAIKQIAIARKLAVSVQSGHYLEEFLQGEGIPVKPLAGPPEQILDIKYGKSLAAAVDSTVGKKLDSEHEGIKGVVLPLPKEKWDLGYGVGIKKSNTALVEEITQAVATLKEDGTITKLSDKWLKIGH